MIFHEFQTSNNPKAGVPKLAADYNLIIDYRGEKYPFRASNFPSDVFGTKYPRTI